MQSFCNTEITHDCSQPAPDDPDARASPRQHLASEIPETAIVSAQAMNTTHNPQTMVFPQRRLQPHLCCDQNGSGKKITNQPERWARESGDSNAEKCANHRTMCKSSAVSQASGAVKSFPAAGRINPHAKVSNPSGDDNPCQRNGCQVHKRRR